MHPRSAALAVLCLALLLAMPRDGVAQEAPIASPDRPSSTSPLPTVPTTRILALGRLVRPWAPGEREAVMPREVAETVRLYLDGRIAEWYARKDRPGVVFVLDMDDVREAHRLLEALPLGVAGLMVFDLVPLGPLSPLALLAPARAAPR